MESVKSVAFCQKRHGRILKEFDLVNTKITFLNFVFFVLLVYPAVYMVSEYIGSGFPGIASRGMLLLLLVAIHVDNRRSEIWNLVLFDICLAIFVAYNLFAHGLNYLVHSDCYGLVFLFCILYFFSNDYRCSCFKEWLSCRSFWLLIVIGVQVIGLLVSVISGSFLDADGYLKGPYLITHEFAYAGLVIYCEICLLNSNHRCVVILVKIAIVVLILASGVRSAGLAAIMLLAYDFFFRRGTSKRSIIGFIAIIFIACLGSILFFVGALDNIPIVEKTLYALSNGDASNGRSRFITIAMNCYNEANPIERFFGVGMENLRGCFFGNPGIGVAIHVHNDIFNILVGSGAFSLVLFIILIGWYLKHTDWFFLFIFLFPLICFNGLYMYMAFVASLGMVKVVFGYVPNVSQKPDSYNKIG